MQAEGQEVKLQCNWEEWTVPSSQGKCWTSMPLKIVTRNYPKCRLYWLIFHDRLENYHLYLSCDPMLNNSPMFYLEKRGAVSAFLLACKFPYRFLYIVTSSTISFFVLLMEKSAIWWNSSSLRIDEVLLPTTKSRETKVEEFKCSSKKWPWRIKDCSFP